MEQHEKLPDRNAEPEKLEQKEGPVILRRYNLENLHPPFTLFRPQNAAYYAALDYPDPAIISVREEVAPESLLKSRRIIEASLYTADTFIRTGDLESLKKYYASWKEIKTPEDMTPHELRERWVKASDGWGRTPEQYAFPDFYEYVAFDDPRDLAAIRDDCREQTLRAWLTKQRKWFDSKTGNSLWVGDVSVSGRDGRIRVITRGIRNDAGMMERHEHPENEYITFEEFEKMCRKVIEPE